jgi:hypothetical protein
VKVGRLSTWSTRVATLDPSVNPGPEPLDRPVMVVVIEGRALVGGEIELGPGQYAVFDAGSPLDLRALTTLWFFEFEFEDLAPTP